MNEPTQDEAAAALEELAVGRRAVSAAERRELLVLLTAGSALVLIDYGAKDHIGDKWMQRLVTGGCTVAAATLTLLDHNRQSVHPVSVDRDDVDLRAAAPLGAAVLGWIVAERLVVTGLRRSGIRWPNTLAGIALAIGRPIGYLGVMRLLPRPRSDV